eukprot:4664492-Lingulodinium_polyedra.AAC.1
MVFGHNTARQQSHADRAPRLRGRMATAAISRAWRCFARIDSSTVAFAFNQTSSAVSFSTPTGATHPTLETNCSMAQLQTRS